MSKEELFLRQALERTDEPFARAKAELARWQAEVVAIENERFGLQRAIDRLASEESAQKGRGLGSLAEVPVSEEALEWRRMNRTDAVERVLKEEGGPLDRREVGEALSARLEQPVELDDISAALSYLRRENRIDRYGKTEWVIREKEPPAAVTDNGWGLDEEPF